MPEKVKIVPNPEVVPPVEEEETKSKFPIKLVRNVVIGAIGVAITGYVVSKLRNKDEDDTETEESPWVNVFVPVPQQEAAE